MPKTIKILFISLILATLIFIIFVLSTEMGIDYNQKYELYSTLKEKSLNQQMR